MSRDKPVEIGCNDLMTEDLVELVDHFNIIQVITVYKTNSK